MTNPNHIIIKNVHEAFITLGQDMEVAADRHGFEAFAYPQSRYSIGRLLVGGRTATLTIGEINGGLPHVCLQEGLQVIDQYTVTHAAQMANISMFLLAQ